MAVLRCFLSSPTGVLYDGDASLVVVPASDGELGVLPRHAPLIGKLGHGEVRIAVGEGSPGKVLRFFLDRGFVQVLENRVNILGVEVEPLEAVSRAGAEARLKELEAQPPPPQAPDEELEKHRHAVDVARARLRLAKG